MVNEMIKQECDVGLTQITVFNIRLRSNQQTGIQINYSWKFFMDEPSCLLLKK